MAITPTGSPAWTRTAGISQYGGNVDKRNYMGIGPIDALTDWSAEEICRMTADLAACVRTAPFAVITFTTNDLSPAAPTISAINLMTGVLSVSYAGNAAPAGYPSASRVGDGRVRFAFSSSYSDEYGVSGAFSPTHAIATVHSDSAAYIVTTSVNTGGVGTVDVRAYTDAGVAAQDVTITVEVH